MTSILSPRESTSSYTDARSSEETATKNETESSTMPLSVYSNSTSTKDTSSASTGIIKIPKDDPRKILSNHELSSRHSSASRSRPSSRVSLVFIYKEEVMVVRT